MIQTGQTAQGELIRPPVDIPSLFTRTIYHPEPFPPSWLPLNARADLVHQAEGVVSIP